MRRPVAWLTALPLMVVGLLGGHALAYRLTIPDGDARGHALAHTGHGYLAYAPAALAVGLTLALATLVVRLLAAVRGDVSRSAPPSIFALLPPLAFALQEHIERLVYSGHVPWTAALEPSFLVGLALQLPFALAALVIAEVFDWLARAVRIALAGERRAFPLLTPALRPRPAPAALRSGILARGYAERAPPSIRHP